MQEKISKILILDFKYQKKKNFKKKKLIFINIKAFILNKDKFIFKEFQILSHKNFNRKQRNRKYLYLNELHKKFLNYLFKKLNIINDINFDKKQWNILQGPGYFII